MQRISVALVFALPVALGACATDKPTTNDPALTGDTCAVYTTAAGCAAGSDCMWFGTGCACPPDDPSCVCSPGSCESTSGSGPSSGSGSASAGCACSDGGVCYQQLGGPAQSGDPPIECTTPSPGSGDPCDRIVDEGACHDSTTVSGLCLCDNGAE